jgi:hypothetical protein
MISSSSMALQPLWALAAFSVPSCIHSMSDSLDQWWAGRKTDTCTQDNANTEWTHTDIHASSGIPTHDPSVGGTEVCDIHEVICNLRLTVLSWINAVEGWIIKTVPNESLACRTENECVKRICPCCYVTDIRTGMASTQVHEVLFFYGTPKTNPWKEKNGEKKEYKWLYLCISVWMELHPLTPTLYRLTSTSSSNRLLAALY